MRGRCRRRPAQQGCSSRRRHVITHVRASRWRPRPPGGSLSLFAGRRALLAGALVALAAPSTALAGDLSDGDLSAPSAAEPLEVATPLTISVMDVAEAGAKKKTGPAARIKELQAKGGSATDKERKELKRLKQEEMCELLGKGC